MQLVADGLLIATALAAAVYCLVLSRRLRRLTDAEAGIGGQIKALNAALEETRSGLAETRRGVAEARAALRNEKEAMARDIEAAKTERAALTALRSRALAAQASLEEMLAGMPSAGQPARPADEPADDAGADAAAERKRPPTPEELEDWEVSDLFGADQAEPWQPVVSPSGASGPAEPMAGQAAAEPDPAQPAPGIAGAADPPEAEGAAAEVDETMPRAEPVPARPAPRAGGSPLRVERMSL
ncbi:hypothetical protein LNKW23_28590 [Paralimibaculum aggregatum]|uniref:Uncharacterized protein n=1 Tax=Paralimibaculum aggregatum TaxID=3036245 RepID=A0ABQ6LRB0_9RHOB|nr:hypothetical protein [Limibaculum sp. NKW23]GMG83646.1 hypothetical protein LNKW23_28590 [Limibaculum sp. NKW23]